MVDLPLPSAGIELARADAPPAAPVAGRLRGEAFALVPFTEERRALIEIIAPVALAFDLHHWRDAVSGDDAGETALLAVLDAARIGTAMPEVGTAHALDARLRALGIVPPTLDAPTIATDLFAAQEALRAAPGDLDLARRYLRLRTLLGAADGTIPASPISDYLDPREATNLDGWSATELAQVLVADARNIAAGYRDLALLDVAAGRLVQVERQFGRLVPDDGSVTTEADFAYFAAFGEWDTFWPAFAEKQREVIGLLLRGIDWRVAAPADGDWVRWSANTPAAHAGKGRGANRALRRARALTLGIAISLLLSLVLFLLPRDLPGSLPDDRLITPAGAECATCPAAARVTGLGFHDAENRRYINVRFAAPPDNERFVPELEGVDARIVAAHNGNAMAWHVGTTTNEIATTDVVVLSRGARVVVTLPGSLSSRGVAVTTTEGVRVPAEGFVSPRTAPRPHINFVDVLIVAALILATWRGLRRGFMTALPSFVGLVLTLVIGRILYPQLGSALGGWLRAVPRVANALAFSLIVTAFGIIVYAVARRMVTATRRALGGRAPVPIGIGMNRALGAPLALAQAALVVPTTLMLAVDLAALSWASGAIRSSLLGTMLVGLWRRIYPGL